MDAEQKVGFRISALEKADAYEKLPKVVMPKHICQKILKQYTPKIAKLLDEQSLLWDDDPGKAYDKQKEVDELEAFLKSLHEAITQWDYYNTQLNKI